MCCYNSSCRPSGFLSWMASWLTFPLCPILAAPLAAISIFRAVRSGSAYAMTRSALLSPFVVVTMCVTVQTAAEYSRGQAVWHAMPKCCFREKSEATKASWSIAPKTRLKVSTQVPHGHQRYTWRVSNRVAKTLVKLYGPQKSSYTGALPSIDDAKFALFGSGRPATAAQMRDLMGYAVTGPNDEFDPISFGKDWRHPCRVYRNSAGRIFLSGTIDNLEVIGTGREFFVLIDPVTNFEVARYGDPSR